jgi:hypothetical protein
MSNELTSVFSADILYGHLKTRNLGQQPAGEPFWAIFSDTSRDGHDSTPMTAKVLIYVEDRRIDDRMT